MDFNSFEMERDCHQTISQMLQDSYPGHIDRKAHTYKPCGIKLFSYTCHQQITETVCKNYLGFISMYTVIQAINCRLFRKVESCINKMVSMILMHFQILLSLYKHLKYTQVSKLRPGFSKFPNQVSYCQCLFQSNHIFTNQIVWSFRK